MNNELYERCTEFYSTLIEERKLTWDEFAKLNGFVSGEALRSLFKRERKKRGVIVSKKEIPLEKKIENTKIVCFDIETTPMTILAWSLWDQYNSPDNIVRDSNILSWSAKELNSAEICGMSLTQEEAISGNDERITRFLWNFLNGSTIIVGHNIKEFDLPYINSRFLYYGLNPLSYYSIIDTLVLSKRFFRFSSNAMKHINKTLNIKQKVENSGMKLWKECMAGNEKSLETMLEYCKGDVVAVEDLYFRLRPFMKGHPNLGLFVETDLSVCPNCSSDNVVEEGFYYTTIGKFTSMRCKNCGALSRKRSSILSKEKRSNLLRN